MATGVFGEIWIVPSVKRLPHSRPNDESLKIIGSSSASMNEESASEADTYCEKVGTRSGFFNKSRI